MVTKDANILALLQQYPELTAILKSKGMACSKCMGASTETIEQGVLIHGLDLVEVLNEINDIIKMANR